MQPLNIHLNNSIISIQVEMQDTIQSIKEKIAKHPPANISSSEQIKLRFESLLLENTKTITDYNIEPNSSLYAEEKHNVQFFVLTLTGKAISIEMDRDEPIRRIKEIIHEKEGVPIDQQMLLNLGRHLENDKLLSEYVFVRDAPIFVVYRLSGGMNNK